MDGLTIVAGNSSCTAEPEVPLPVLQNRPDQAFFQREKFKGSADILSGDILSGDILSGDILSGVVETHSVAAAEPQSPLAVFQDGDHVRDQAVGHREGGYAVAVVADDFAQPSQKLVCSGKPEISLAIFPGGPRHLAAQAIRLREGMEGIADILSVALLSVAILSGVVADDMAGAGGEPDVAVLVLYGSGDLVTGQSFPRGKGVKGVAVESADAGVGAEQQVSVAVFENGYNRIADQAILGREGVEGLADLLPVDLLPVDLLPADLLPADLLSGDV